jgi:hypothetical protein
VGCPNEEVGLQLIFELRDGSYLVSSVDMRLVMEAGEFLSCDARQFSLGCFVLGPRKARAAVHLSRLHDNWYDVKERQLAVHVMGDFGRPIKSLKRIVVEVDGTKDHLVGKRHLAKPNLVLGLARKFGQLLSPIGLNRPRPDYANYTAPLTSPRLQARLRSESINLFHQT